MQPNGRTDFRATISKWEYDQGWGSIHKNSGEPFSASGLELSMSRMSRQKFHAVVRFLLEKELLVKSYGKKSFQVKNCDTFCQECESLWETQSGMVQENEDAWQEYLRMRSTESRKKDTRKKKTKITVEQYDLMRMSHFADKLELLIDNCPRTSLNENAQLRVSVPHFQTKDAIEQIKIHVTKLIEQKEIECHVTKQVAERMNNENLH